MVGPGGTKEDGWMVSAWTSAARIKSESCDGGSSIMMVEFVAQSSRCSAILWFSRSQNKTSRVNVG